MKILLDTCIYIEYFRTENYRDFFVSREKIRYLSPVVAAELLAGARDKKQSHVLKKFIHVYAGASRIVEPTTDDFLKAGQILALLRQKNSRANSSLMNDALIACHTRKVGATLLTSNKKDFTAIQHYLDFSCTFL